MTTTTAHHHYFDYGYGDWQCIEDDTSSDYCEAERRERVSTETGAVMAGRWPAGLHGTHPAFIAGQAA